MHVGKNFLKKGGRGEKKNCEERMLTPYITGICFCYLEKSMEAAVFKCIQNIPNTGLESRVKISICFFIYFIHLFSRNCVWFARGEKKKQKGWKTVTVSEGI